MYRFQSHDKQKKSPNRQARSLLPGRHIVGFMRIHWRFRNKIFLLLISLLMIQALFMAWGFYQTLSSSVEHQIRTRALIQAKEIANDPELIASVGSRDTKTIKAITERLMHYSDASFIVIGDQNGIRLFHPVADRIGHPMQGGDNDGALLRGESYTFVREGSLGYGVRGKAPIINARGEIIGVVSVGYLLTRFDRWLKEYLKPLMLDAFFLLMLVFFSVWLFTRHIQKKMNNMEPEEITLSWEIQQSILHAIYEGIIAVDRKGQILIINPSAQQYLPQGADDPYSMNICDFLDDCDWLEQPDPRQLSGRPKDEFYQFNGYNIIANREAVFHDNELVGWVMSFREQNDIHAVTASLTQIKQYSDNLRVLRHEFSNKLTTLSGLLKMGKTHEALQLINSESDNRQATLDFIKQTIRINQVAAFLLGKALRARELNIELNLDPTCQLSSLKGKLDENQLCTILGNLIDNAFDSCRVSQTASPQVGVLITDAGQDLLIEISDNGTGLGPEEKEHVWKRGVTRKPDPDNHGIGLYLVHRHVDQAGGFINIDDASPQGCIFSVFIPNGSR